jgi:hypothetical protein
MEEGRPRERGYGEGNSPEGVEDCARVQQGRSAISPGRLGPLETVSTGFVLIGLGAVLVFKGNTDECLLSGVKRT